MREQIVKTFVCKTFPHSRDVKREVPEFCVVFKFDLQETKTYFLHSYDDEPKAHALAKRVLGEWERRTDFGPFTLMQDESTIAEYEIERNDDKGSSESDNELKISLSRYYRNGPDILTAAKPESFVACKVVAVKGWGGDWSAYWGESDKSDDEIRLHGDKISRQAAEALFPTFKALGMFYRE